MFDQNLSNAFEDCIERMARGQSIEDCLRLYPQHAVNLRWMLETGQFVKRIQPRNPEIALAAERVRFRIQAHQRQHRLYPVGWTRLAVAAAVFVLLVLGTGITAAGVYLSNNLNAPTVTQTPTLTMTTTPTATSTVTTTIRPRSTYVPTFTQLPRPTSMEPSSPPAIRPTSLPTDDHGNDDHSGSGSSDNSGSGGGGDNSGSGSGNSGSGSSGDD